VRKELDELGLGEEVLGELGVVTSSSSEGQAVELEVGEEGTIKARVQAILQHGEIQIFYTLGPTPHLLLLPPSPKQPLSVPLSSDSAFLLLLSLRLRTLSTLQEQQTTQFTSQITTLTHSIHPSDKKDLYKWREIFSKWKELEIFEGQTEGDRGGREVDESERRLGVFVQGLGLGGKRKRRDGTVEDFLMLNRELLNLKRFWGANELALKKILKKHDKRTSLQVSKYYDTSERRGGLDKLPHVLLCQITQILLPIIPSIDDFSCPICSEIAWKPIRLICSHIFCLRCLSKMQKRHQNPCPICRSEVVMATTREGLDKDMLEFMKEWFPKESKMKNKENWEEVKKELGGELGDELQVKGCLVM